jgi:hypothetical protein
LSAQVTLGRALIELEQFDEARRELEAVLRVAPDNLAAIRALAGIHEHLGDADHSFVVAADSGAELPAVSAEIVRAPAASEPPMVPPPPNTEIPMVQHTDPALPALEHWLSAIVADRAHSR